MFESAELEHDVTKPVFRREEAKLRAQLLNAQYDLKENGRFPVLILIAGVEGAGKGETVNLLNAWMDPRHIQTHAFADPTDIKATMEVEKAVGRPIQVQSAPALLLRRAIESAYTSIDLRDEGP